MDQHWINIGPTCCACWADSCICIWPHDVSAWYFEGLSGFINTDLLFDCFLFMTDEPSVKIIIAASADLFFYKRHTLKRSGTLFKTQPPLRNRFVFQTPTSGYENNLSLVDYNLINLHPTDKDYPECQQHLFWIYRCAKRCWRQQSGCWRMWRRIICPPVSLLFLRARILSSSTRCGAHFYSFTLTLNLTFSVRDYTLFTVGVIRNTPIIYIRQWYQ